MTPPLWEERAKSPAHDVPLNPLDESVEGAVYSDSLEPGRVILLDNYLKGWVRIEVCGRFRSLEVKPRYWVAIFERSMVEFPFGVGDSFWQAPPQRAEVEHAHRHQQQTMLVDVVESAEDPERHSPSLIASELGVARSLVRLAFFEKAEDLEIVDRGLKVGGRKWLSLLAEWRVTNRELSLLPRNPVLAQHQLPREVVECRAEVIGDFADLQRPLGLDRGNAVYPTDVVLGLWVKLDTETVAVGIKSPFDALLQIGGVALRPADFAGDAAESEA